MQTRISTCGSDFDPQLTVSDPDLGIGTLILRSCDANPFFDPHLRIKFLGLWCKFWSGGEDKVADQKAAISNPTRRVGLETRNSDPHLKQEIFSYYKRQ